MAQRNTRIRWNEEERSTILAAYQMLRAQDPKRGVANLFGAAQKALPPQRRRALDYKLRGWLEGDSKGVRIPRRASAAAVAAESAAIAPATLGKRSKGAAPSAATTASTAPALETSQPRAVRAAASARPSSAAIAKVIVEMGSEIVADILSSARVQQALRTLLQAAWPSTAFEARPPQPFEPDSAEPTAAPHAPPTPGAVPEAHPANGKLRVLIAGMEQREGAALAKTYDDTLELVCWSAEDGLGLLPEAVARADVVVGMMSLLSQPVEQTLRRHAKRYVRNARGVAGLRSELAGLALSGHGSAGVAGA